MAPLRLHLRLRLPGGTVLLRDVEWPPVPIPDVLRVGQGVGGFLIGPYETCWRLTEAVPWLDVDLGPAEGLDEAVDEFSWSGVVGALIGEGWLLAVDGPPMRATGEGWVAAHGAHGDN